MMISGALNLAEGVLRPGARRKNFKKSIDI